MPSGYSLFTNCSFDAIKNKLNCYRDRDCMKGFCEDLREHAMKIIDYEEKEMIPLTNEQNNICYMCKKGFSTDALNKKFQGKRSLSLHRKI